MKNIPPDFFTSSKFLITFIVVVTSIIYFQSFFFDLIYLDDEIIVYERFERDNILDETKNAFTSNYLRGHYYRPLTLFTFILDSALSGKSYFFYHLSNYLIHLFTCLLLFVTLIKFGYSLLIAFVSTLIFALNPIHINAIGWIAGRGDLLAGFFSLLALFFFQKFLNRKQLAFLIIVFISLLLAILSKESSLLLPFLLLVFVFEEKRDFTLNKKNAASLLMILIVFGCYYIIRSSLSEVHIDKFSFTTFNKNLLILPETTSKFFIPIGLKALPSFELFTSIFGGIIFSILLVLPFIIKNVNKFRYYFGFIWFVTLMFPSMVFQTMGQDGFFYWDCRSYLPAIGLIFLIVEILKSVEFSKHKTWIYNSVAIYLIVIIVSTFFMIKIYKNAPSYWSSVKSDYPQSYLPYVGLYNYYNHSGNLTRAESQLVNAVELRPEESTIRQLLVNFYLKNNEKEKAFNEVKGAVLKESFSSDFYLEKFISLSIETDQFDEIEKLTEKYVANNKIIGRINETILKEIQNLENADDTIRTQKLRGKINEIL